MKLAWTRRWPPLEPEGVVAFGESAVERLARKVLAREPADYEGVMGRGVLALLGAEPPWIDGAQFIARCVEAPGLWLLTTAQLTIHPLCLTRRLRAMDFAGPVLVTPSAIVPLGAARPVDRARLVSALGRRP